MEAKLEINTKKSYPMDTVPFNGELSRLVTAAVVNKKFCDLLLEHFFGKAELGNEVSIYHKNLLWSLFSAAIAPHIYAIRFYLN